jgi:hypothetical protein
MNFANIEGGKYVNLHSPYGFIDNLWTVFMLLLPMLSVTSTYKW